jgi:hypothetical protein
MSSVNLLSVCGSAFVGVFLLLAVLALIMRIILYIFPQREAGTDVAVLAAVTAVVGAVYPGSEVTKVEEVK